MSKIVGIDLGTTHSLVATVDSGIPMVIADAAGQRLTPSVIHIPRDGELVVGHAARRARIAHPSETVYSIKRFMGRAGRDLGPEDLQVSYELGADGVHPVTVLVNGRQWRPEELSAEVLKKVKRDAEAFFGEPVTRAVVTVPAYFNDAQRNATKRAGELAGLGVERILNEPTAAALAYGLDKLKHRARIAVYDLGGGTFDLSILELNEGVFQVLATNGNTRLGGDDLDRRLVAFLEGRIRSAGGPDATGDAVLQARLREAAEDAKIRLSAEEAVDIALPFLGTGFHFQCRLTREELEDLTRDLIARTRPHCLRAMADAKVEPADLEQVILVGGQTRMPLVRRMVAEIFDCMDEEGSDSLREGSKDARRRPLLNTRQNPDEAVALGAAIQAEILSGGFRNVLLLDVTPLSLGIETFGGLMNVIIPRNSTIPIKRGEMFTTAVDHQRSLLVHVLQGERERARDNWSLGRFTLDFDPAPRGVPRVGVQFEIDADGILRVLARDVQSGRERVVEMKSAVDVDDAEVQRMVEESLDHAFDDLAARRWIEARLRAEEAASATRKALADCAAQMEPEYLRQVESALAAVEAAMATGDGGSEVGDLDRLKSVTHALDEATRPLADHLMDQAMEAVLRRRGALS